MFASKVKWENRLIGDVGAVCLVTVDGTDFHIHEPKPFNKRWWSHKFNGPGIRYEIAICIQTGLIVWVNGPFACGEWTDIVIFRSALIHMLDRQGRHKPEMVEADGGYNGEAMHVRVRDEPNVSVIQFIAKARARARHEAVNGRLKAFVVLRVKFRHSLHLHGAVFRAVVVVVVNIAMANGSPTFHVHYPAPGSYN